MESQIAVRLPEELVQRLDRAADLRQVSRSQVVRAAIRAYLEEPLDSLPEERPLDRVRGLSGIVHEAAALYAAGLGEYRAAQLESDLALTPEERVREAEETARLSDLQRRGWRSQRLLVFERYEDYLDWKRFGD